MSDLLAVELLKLRTTRTAWALLAATVGVSALAVASAVVVGADSTSLDLESSDGIRTVLSVMANGSVFMLVLGVIISAGEFRHGTATDTHLSTPSPWRVVTAKLGVATTVGVGFGAVSAAVAMTVAALTYGIKGFTLPLDSGDVWSTFGGAVLFAALFGAIGAATGSLIRNQVSAIVGWLVWLGIVEHLAVGLLPDLGRWLPGAAGQALVRGPNDDLLGQGPAAIVLAMYCVAIAATAVVVGARRDA